MTSLKDLQNSELPCAHQTCIDLTLCYVGNGLVGVRYTYQSGDPVLDDKFQSLAELRAALCTSDL